MSVTPSPVPSNGHDAVDDRIDLKRHLIVRASTPQPTAALVPRCWVERPRATPARSPRSKPLAAVYLTLTLLSYFVALVLLVLMPRPDTFPDFR
jgi:hypothetical protein